MRKVTLKEIEPLLALRREEIQNINDDLSETLKKKSFILVGIGDEELYGFAYMLNREDEDEPYLIGCYVSKVKRRVGYGSKLMKYLIEASKKNKLTPLMTETISEVPCQSFLSNFEFEFWFASYKMILDKAEPYSSKLEIRPYNESCYLLVSDLRSRCFLKVRKENSLKPYWIESSQSEKILMNDESENYHLAYDKDILIGLIKISDSVIDLIMIDIRHQRKGYGKGLLGYGIETIFNNGYKQIELEVMASNEHVKKLYEKVGFRIKHKIEVYRRKL